MAKERDRKRARVSLISFAVCDEGPDGAERKTKYNKGKLIERRIAACCCCPDTRTTYTSIQIEMHNGDRRVVVITPSVDL